MGNACGGVGLQEEEQQSEEFFVTSSLSNRWTQGQQKMSDVIHQSLDTVKRNFERRGCARPDDEHLVRLSVKEALKDSDTAFQDMFLCASIPLKLSESHYKSYDFNKKVFVQQETGYCSFDVSSFVGMLRKTALQKLQGLLGGRAESIVDETLSHVRAVFEGHNCTTPEGKATMWSNVRQSLQDSERSLNEVYISLKHATRLSEDCYTLCSWFEGQYTFDIGKYLDLLRKAALQQLQLVGIPLDDVVFKSMLDPGGEEFTSIETATTSDGDSEELPAQDANDSRPRSGSKESATSVGSEPEEKAPIASENHSRSFLCCVNKF